MISDLETSLFCLHVQKVMFYFCSSVQMKLFPALKTSLLYRCGQQTVLFRFLNLFCIQEVLFYSLHVITVEFLTLISPL